MHRISAATAIILALSAPAGAQAPAFQLDDIIFSAGLSALEAARVGVSVEVVTEEELQDAGDLQVSEYLDTLPGVSVTQSGPIGNNATLRIRGLNGNYIPVLINGIDVTDPSAAQTAFNFGTLTTGGVSRIEVLYGSQSAIYGSEAIAGVINITTLEAPEDIGTEVTFNAEAGSFGTYLGSVGLATRFDRGTLTFSAARMVTDGFSAADENDGNTEPDAFNATTLTATATYDLTDRVTLGASLFFEDSFTEFDASGGPFGDAARFYTSEQTGARVFAQFDGVYVDHEIAAQAFHIERADPTAPAFFTTTDFEGDRRGLSYQASIDLGADRTFVAGAEYVEEDQLAFRPGGASFPGSYTITSVLADYSGPVSQTLDVNAALRFDEHSVYGSSTTGRLALAWRPDGDTTVRASLSNGFRAPSLNELYGPFGANPNLDPEQSRSAEISFERQFGTANLGAGLFYTEIDDLIVYTTMYQQVPGTTVSQGLELTGEMEVMGGLTVFGNYTYTDIRDRTGARILRVPYHDVTLGLRGDVTDRVSGTFTLQHVAGTQDVVFGGPPAFATMVIDLPDYTVANLSLGYAVTDETEVYMRVDNLFNQEYQTTIGYGTSDRAAYFGVRSRF